MAAPPLQRLAAALAVAFGSYMAGPVPALAGQAPTNPLTLLSLDELGAVEVTTVSKEPETVWRTPAAVHVITHDDIVRSGATSIPEALRLAPGIDVARIDTAHWSVGVRGFGEQFSKTVLILIDGRNVYTPLFAGIYWAAHDVPIEDVDRIEVVRGPGGTIWGANAVTGVVNIITRDAAQTRGTLVSLSGGTSDHVIASVRHGATIAPGVSYRIWGRGFARGPQFHADDASYDDWQMGIGGGRVDWSSASLGRLTLQGGLSTGRHGQRIRSAVFAPASVVTIDDPVDTTGGYLLSRWERDLSASHALQLQAYYDGSSWDAPHFRETRHTVDLDLVERVRTSRHRLTWGGGFRVSPSTFEQTLASLAITPAEQTDWIVSAFAQDELTLVSERLFLTVGSKFEQNSYTGFEVQPSVRAVWTPAPTRTVWSAATHAVRTPSRVDAGFSGYTFASAVPSAFLRVVGNPDLEAEGLVGYELGYRQLLTPRVFVDLAVFRHEHDGLTTFRLGPTRVEGAPPRLVVDFPYMNGIDGASHGIELASDWRPADWWRVRGSYSYLQIDLENRAGVADPRAASGYEGASPRHHVLLAGSASLRRTIDVDLTFRAASEAATRVVPGYKTADVRVGWRVSPDLEMAVAGRNLLQPHHVEFAPGVGVERSALVTATWSLGSALP